ncbi:MAG TPA: histidine kinase [Gemmatimonadaceae bacterium]|nr:histidine kinase [Gemmatimonadaceae bacterium]
MTQRARWTAALLLSCGLLTILAGTQNYYANLAEGATAVWWRMVCLEATYWFMWGALLPAIVSLCRRTARLRELRARIASYIAMGFIVSPIQAAAVYALRITFLSVSSVRSMGLGFFVWQYLIFDMITYSALLGGVLAFEHWRRSRTHELAAAQLSAELSQAHLRALQMQLHPHFLFNTLNTVSMLVRTNDGPGAVRMLAGLGDLLRQMLDDNAAHEIPLREELAFLEGYLAIEQTRFHDRLRVVMQVDPAALDAHVPRLLLQPLVENAIRHGVARQANGGTLTIVATRAGESLSLSVRDEGTGSPIAANTNGDGVGLRNTRERLRRLYGTTATLSLETPRTGGTGGAEAVITLPWHTRPLSVLDGTAR